MPRALCEKKCTLAPLRRENPLYSNRINAILDLRLADDAAITDFGFPLCDGAITISSFRLCIEEWACDA